MIETRNGEIINPDRPRWIERSGARQGIDVTFDEAETILEAISRGSQTHCFEGVDDTRPQIVASSIRKITLTVYLCPLLKRGRYAVQVWVGPFKWTRDFVSEEAALIFQTAERHRLGL